MDETTKDYLQDKINQYVHLKDFKRELEKFLSYSVLDDSGLYLGVSDEHGNSKKTLTQKSMSFYYGDCPKEFFNKLKKAVNDIIIEEIEEAEKKMQEL